MTINNLIMTLLQSFIAAYLSVVASQSLFYLHLKEMLFRIYMELNWNYPSLSGDQDWQSMGHDQGSTQLSPTFWTEVPVCLITWYGAPNKKIPSIFVPERELFIVCGVGPQYKFFGSPLNIWIFSKIFMLIFFIING